MTVSEWSENGHRRCFSTMCPGMRIEAQVRHDVVSFFDSVSTRLAGPVRGARIADKRLIRKLLKAGALEDGVVTVSEMRGTGVCNFAAARQHLESYDALFLGVEEVPRTCAV